MKYLMIGGGPACVSAAATLCRIDPTGSVTILTDENHYPYAKMVLPYLISGAVDKEQLMLGELSGAQIHLGKKVVQIHTEKHQVVTLNGDIFDYDRLLVGSGGTPEKIDVEGAEFPFVFTIRTLDDVQGILNCLRGKTGRVVIAGAGPVSMEIGDALHEIGMDITFVISSNRVFSTLLDLKAARFVEDKLLEKGVEIIKGTDITRIGQDGEVYLSSGESRKSEIVIIGKGVKPNMQFLEGSGIENDWGISVDEHQQTNIEDIYAAGDVAQTYDIVYQDSRVNALWPAAYEQGKVAAYNMAGIPTDYRGSLARNILKVFGVSILSAGMARADQGDVFYDEGKNHFRKIVLDGGILKGLIMIGDVRNEGLYMSLMIRGVDVSEFAGAILKDTYSYPRFLAATVRKKA